jgi:hypothetical protein
LVEKENPEEEKLYLKSDKEFLRGNLKLEDDNIVSSGLIHLTNKVNLEIDLKLTNTKELVMSDGQEISPSPCPLINQ